MSMITVFVLISFSERLTFSDPLRVIDLIGSLSLLALLFTKFGRARCMIIFDIFIIAAVIGLTYSLIKENAGPQSPDYHYYFILLFFILIFRLSLTRVIIHAVILTLATGVLFFVNLGQTEIFLVLFEYRLVFYFGIAALILVKLVERRHAMDRKKLEMENLKTIRLRSVFMDAMISINELIADETNFQDTLDAIGKIAKSITGARHIWLYLIPEDQTDIEIYHLDQEPEIADGATRLGLVSGKLSAHPEKCQNRYAAFDKNEPYIATTFEEYTEGQFDAENSLEFQRLLGAEKIVCIPFMKKLEKQNYYAAMTFVFQHRQFDLFILKLFVSAFGASVLLNKTRAQRQQAHAELEKAHYELKETQGKMITLEKSVQIAGIAAGITHDINNPLGALKASVDLVSKSNKRLKSERFTEENLNKFVTIIDSALDVIHLAMDRINSVVTALKNFSQLDRARITFVDLNESVENVILLLQAQILNRVYIDKSLSPLPRLKCNPQEINQLAMNLIQNAVEASPKGGVVRISTIQDNNHVSLEVSDKGPGINKEIRKKLFDPMFSTKVNHVGMGLTLVKDIVARHNGSISCHSDPVEGTTFCVTLPIGSPFLPLKVD